MNELTYAIAKELFDYDPESGLLIRKPIPPYKKLKPVKYIHHSGYIPLRYGKKFYLAHRVIFLIMTGEWPKNHIDHINGIKSDNRWCNLRDVTRSINQLNQTTPPRGNKTGFRGVRKGRNGFIANITVNGRQTYLGKYDTAELAHQAYVAQKSLALPYEVKP